MSETSQPNACACFQLSCMAYGRIYTVNKLACTIPDLSNSYLYLTVSSNFYNLSAVLRCQLAYNSIRVLKHYSTLYEKRLLYQLIHKYARQKNPVAPG